MSGREKASRGALKPAGRLAGLRPYVRGPSARAIDLRLDANEGAPSFDRLASVLGSIDREVLRRYPDTGALEGRIAALWGVSAERVVVTNGGDDAIDRVCRAVVEEGRTAVVHTPAFEMIERGALLAGGEVCQVGWLGGAFPVSAFVGAIGERTGLVALVSPNNPTGGVIGLEEMVAIVRAARDVGALVLVDLAYVEFADADPTAALLEFSNVVVVRTFSKAMGLAGLRVGYAIASAEVAGWLRTVGGPYPVSNLSLALARASLEDEAGRAAFVEEIRRERTRLEEVLGDLDAEVFASQANFVFARFADAEGVREGLGERGIAVRGFGEGSGIGDCLRITLPGDAGEFLRLEAAVVAELDEMRSGR